MKRVRNWVKVDRDMVQEPEIKAPPKVLPLHLFYPEPSKQQLHPCITASPGDGWELIKGVMDSGASESVANPRTCEQYEPRPSKGSKAGMNYVSASGDVIPNLGEKVINVVAHDGRESTVKYQRTLASNSLTSQVPP